MAKLKELRAKLIAEKKEVVAELDGVRGSGAGQRTSNGVTASSSNKKGKGKGIDYTEDFDWAGELKARMRNVFKIQDFRLCQKGYVPHRFGRISV